jgi:hypothetical protein
MSFGQTLKRVSAVLALVLVVGIALIYVFRGSITAWLLLPSESIVDEPMWSPLDYQQSQYWRASPQIPNDGWQVSFDDGFAVGTPLADVFYVHPTAFFSASWNSELTEGSYSEQMLDAMMISQASAFSECCEVWAPRFREATIYAFFDETMTNGPAALDRAYIDVRAAFEHFLANRDQSRPFIIASHSQGTIHSVRLLHDYVDGKKLQEDMVAAYIVGYSLSESYVSELLPSIPVCQSEFDQGCLVHWDSAMPEGRMTMSLPYWYPDGWRLISDSDAICVNPVSWLENEQSTASSEHLGALLLDFKTEFAQAYSNRPMPDAPSAGHVVENAYAATCANGLLRVSGIDPMSPFMGGVSEDRRLHLYDFNLFWLDIRRNALERTMLH